MEESLTLPHYLKRWTRSPPLLLRLRVVMMIRVLLRGGDGTSDTVTARKGVGCYKAPLVDLGVVDLGMVDLVHRQM